MLNDPTFTQLKGILNEMNIDAEVTPHSDLLNNGTLDSMDWLAYLARIEERFNVKIGANAEHIQLGIMGKMVTYLKEAK